MYPVAGITCQGEGRNDINYQKVAENHGVASPICHQEGQSKRLFKIFAFSSRILLLFPIFPLFFPIFPCFLDFFQIFCKFFPVRVATPLLKTRLKEVRICQNLVRPGICTISVSLTTTKMWAHTMIRYIGDLSNNTFSGQVCVDTCRIQLALYHVQARLYTEIYNLKKGTNYRRAGIRHHAIFQKHTIIFPA